jgi:hypothetical protein
MLLPLTPVTGGTKDELAKATRDSGIGFLAIVPCILMYVEYTREQDVVER